MTDLSLVKIRDSAQPSDILVEADAVLLRLPRVNQAEEVLIDGISVPFSLSRNMIRVPTADINTSFDHVEVVFTTFYGGGTSYAQLQVGLAQPFVRGVSVLLQRIVYGLLCEPGTNVFRPRDGAGALRSAAQADGDETLIRIGLAGGVAIVEEQIMREQMAARLVTREERLISLRLNEVSVLSSGTIRAELVVHTMAKLALLAFPV